MVKDIEPHTHRQEEEPVIPGSFWAFIAGVCIGLLATTCVSCTTTRYVEVPGPTHTDTVRITQQQRDSIHIHDSIYVSEKRQGDTVFVQTVKWHTAWRDRLVRDTFRLVSIDSIPYRVEVPVEVPAKLTWWQELRIHLGGICFWLLVILCGWNAVRLWRKMMP